MDVLRILLAGGSGVGAACNKASRGRSSMAPIHSLTLQDMNNVIKTLNLRHSANVSILNKGQLDSALKKPSLALYGKEMYPMMYEKAAVLMESICKFHCLTDGNKRSSMMAAEYFVSINGATLVLPLKSVRLTVDCAMDADDQMSEELSMWFKTHIADNPVQLSVMLEELVEEREVVASLWKQEKFDEAEQLVDSWLAFDSYPEGRKIWRDLVKRWERRDEMLRTGLKKTHMYYDTWLSITSSPDMVINHPHFPSLPEHRIANPRYTGHGLADMKRAECVITTSVKKLRASLDKPAALWVAGRVLEGFRYYDEAVYFYDKLLCVDKDRHHVLYHKLINLVPSERYTEAQSIVDELVASDPQNPALNQIKSVTYMGLEDYQTALKAINTSLNHKPDYLPYLATKSNILHKIDSNDADKIDEQIYKLNPNDVTSMGNMAVVLSKHGQHKKAAELLESVLQKSPRDSLALYYMGLSMSELGRDDRALDFYKKSLKLDPDRVETLVNVGAIYTNTGRMSEALPYLEKALDKDPVHPVGILNMAKTLFLTGELEMSAKMIDRLLSKEPRNHECLYMLALVHLKAGRIHESRSILRRLLKIDPTYESRIKENPEFQEAGLP